jgi:hypothetical protein
VNIVYKQYLNMPSHTPEASLFVMTTKILICNHILFCNVKERNLSHPMAQLEFSFPLII